MLARRLARPPEDGTTSARQYTRRRGAVLTDGDDQAVVELVDAHRTVSDLASERPRRANTPGLLQSIGGGRTR